MDGIRSRNSLLFSYKGGPYATMVVLKRENTSEITYFIEYHAPPEKKKKTDDDKKVCPEGWTFKKKKPNHLPLETQFSFVEFSLYFLLIFSVKTFVSRRRMRHYGNTQPTAAIGASNESYIPPLSGKKKFVKIGIRDRKLEPVE